MPFWILNKALCTHRRLNAPVRRGVENNKAKLDERKIQQIFLLRDKGHTTYEIAEIFGVSRSAICSALNRHTWRHVDVTYYFR